MKSLEGKIDKKAAGLAAGFVASMGVAVTGNSAISYGLNNKGKPLLYIGGAMLLASVPVAVYCVKKLHDLLGNNINYSCRGK